MMKSERTRIFMISLAAAAVFILVSYFFPPVPMSLGSVAFDRASSSYPFTIQNLMWIAFFICTGELYHRTRFIRSHQGGLKAEYLSERPDIFYDLNDLASIRRKTHEKTDLVAKLINILIIRYQVSHRAVDETHQMLNTQLELMQYRLDVDYTMVRYIVWLIPSLGFIGTVKGISDALSVAGIPGASASDSFLPDITVALALAFDTTLVALLMSSVLLYIMHLVQGREERLIERCGSYCLDNLVNKLMTNYSADMNRPNK